MKNFYFLLLLIILQSEAISQQTFIKSTTNTAFGANIRILPMSDLGWIVCSLDSLNISKFNNCGNIEWSRRYQLPNANSSLTDIIKTSDDGIAILTRLQRNNVHYSLVTKLDATGTFVWSRSYENSDFEQFPYSISEDKLGNLFVFANVEYLNGSPFYNMVIKLDNSGNLLWSNFYNHGGIWGGAITTSDNGVLIRTGSIFIKIDNNGNLLWSVSLAGMPYNYYAPIEVSDGYILTGTQAGNQYISFYKIGLFGNQVWQERKTLNVFGNPKVLKSRSNGNFSILVSSNSGGIYTALVVEFDKDLIVKKAGGVDLSNLGIGIFAKDLCFLKEDTPVLAAVNFSSSEVIVAKFDKNYFSGCSFIGGNVSISLNQISIASIGTSVLPASLVMVNNTFTFNVINNSQLLVCPGSKSLDLGADLSVCTSVSSYLKNNTADFFENYLWSTGDTTQSISVNQPGTFWLRAWDNCEQVVYSDTILIESKQTIEPKLGDDLILCENETVLLKAPLCDSCTYRWSNNDTLAFYVVKEGGEVWLQVKNSFGCIGFDTIQVDTALCDCNIYFPNAFTPNSDGLNDVFYPQFYCQISDYNLEIFDRWGKSIYQTSNLNENWNGKLNSQLVPIGVYVYKVSYQSIIKGVNAKPSAFSGRVSVMY